LHSLSSILNDHRNRVWIASRSLVLVTSERSEMSVKFRRRSVFAVSIALVVVLCAVGLASAGVHGRTAGSAPVKGGTLTLLGQSDIFNLDTTSGYYTVDNILERSFTRQLVSYPNAPSFLAQIQLKPDIATAVPTKANGGISKDGRTYTLHIKPGVKWNTSPARQVTAADFVREFKLLCNPASPTGAPGYYQSTIVGMASYCTGFAKVKGTAPAIAAYVNGHAVPGVVAKNALTLVFKLVKPAPDFPNILAMGFSSARPVEYMKYVPDSADFRQHTISDGPYQITKYVPGKEFVLDRNPAWDAKTDSLRHAYVDHMKVTQGLTQDSVQQQIQAGTGDMDWDVTPPAQSLPGLIAAKDPRLVIGPTGPYYVALNTYLALNQYAGPMKNKLVRQAAEYALNKNAVVQIFGGPRIATPANQVVLPGNVGYIKNFNPYPNNGGNGDPAKAKALLAKSGLQTPVPLKLLYATTEPAPRVAQSIQASLEKGGFKVTLVPTTGADFYGKYMLVPSTAKKGTWDIAAPGWIPDWFGNNGRSVIQPLFTKPQPGSSDFGGYNSPVTNRLVNQALTSVSPEAAEAAWRKANAQIMSDAAAVPIEFQKFTAYHSSRLQGCVFWFFDINCDPTNVWLKG
jgi:peptide/nickel transport system substrate-binding protein